MELIILGHIIVGTSFFILNKSMITALYLIRRGSTAGGY